MSNRYAVGVLLLLSSGCLQRVSLALDALLVNANSGCVGACDLGLFTIGMTETNTITIANRGGGEATNVRANIEDSTRTLTFAGDSYPGAGGTCSTVLAGGATCTMVIEIAPATTDPINAALLLWYSSGATEARQTRLPLSFTGVHAASLSLSEVASCDTGPLGVGQTRDCTVTVENLGDREAQELSAATLTAPFGFVGGAYPGTGGSCGTVIAAGDACTLTIAFAPTAAGVYSDLLDLRYTTTIGARSATHGLTGTGVVASHQGWQDVRAIGASTPVTQSGLSSSAASLTVSWAPMQLAPTGAITGYSVFRATSPGGQSFASPLISGLGAATRSYTDTTVVGGTTYYYVVRPELGSQTLPTSDPDSELAVLMPWDNMILVHRWIANQEMCSLMGLTIDRANNYRCDYAGPGDDGSGHFDIGHSVVFDTYETGCNYTAAPACGDASNGCLGVAVPAGGVGVVDDVFYNRSSGDCFIKTDATTWRNSNDATLTTAQMARMQSNRPGLPPLVWISQSMAASFCGAVVTSGVGAKRLPRHQEHILALAWDPSLSDSEIDSLENGASLPSTDACNANLGDGLVFDDNVMPADIETLPFTLASNPSYRAVRTGGMVTENCVSRYGLRDGPGNVSTWDSDQIYCDQATNICDGVTSSVDPSNNQWDSYVMDGTMGPSVSTVSLSNWSLPSMQYDATRYLLPLGLPLVGTSSLGMAIGTGTGELPPDALHNDGIYVSTTRGTSLRGAIAEGAWGDGSWVGRFDLSLEWPASNIGSFLGVRCVHAVP